MKTHQRWKESINEKIYFVNILHDKLDNRFDSLNNGIQRVNFHCSAPGAKTVHLAGNFNHWHPILMEQRKDDCWFIQVWLPRGHHHYRFLIDGRPALAPCAAGITQDEHNEAASLMVVS